MTTISAALNETMCWLDTRAGAWTATNKMLKLKPTSIPLLSCLVLMLALSGCGPGPDARVRDLIEATRQQAKPDELRESLVPLFSYEGHRYAKDAVVLTNELPRRILDLAIFAERPSLVDVDRVRGGNVLMLATGSGFGHWGIVVVRPGFQESFEDTRYTLWGDGVYFFNDYK